jgi:Ca2+-binding RTX toxin-like protein
MRLPPRAPVALAAVAASLVLGLAAARGSTNTVSSSNATRFTATIGANTLKPATCSSLTLSTTVRGVTGTSGNDLVLATASADVISAGNGNDCVLGGGGGDTIDGGPGTDVCIGGPGTDTFANCETQIQ